MPPPAVAVIVLPWLAVTSVPLRRHDIGDMSQRLAAATSQRRRAATPAR